MREGGGVHVRRAGPADLLRVLAIHAHRGPGVEPPARATAQEQQTWDEMMARDGLTPYVAELDAEPVGTATVVLMPNLTYACAPTAFIEAVVVDHRYRRRGVATAILRVVLDDAGAAGCNKGSCCRTSATPTTASTTSTSGSASSPRRRGFSGTSSTVRPRHVT